MFDEYFGVLGIFSGFGGDLVGSKMGEVVGRMQYIGYEKIQRLRVQVSEGYLGRVF